MKLLLTLLILVSCTTLKKEDCTYDYGFASGVNDARADLPMNKHLDKRGVCTITSHRELVNGYREGYSVELRTRVAQTHLSKPDVAQGQKLLVPECLVAYGERRCGYGCLIIYGQVRCAKNPGSSCMAAYGDLRCGKNCEVLDRRIQCASYE